MGVDRVGEVGDRAGVYGTDFTAGSLAWKGFIMFAKSAVFTSI